LGVVVDLGKSAVGIAMGVKINGWVARAMKRMIIDKSIMETGGIKETLSVGRFDFFG
jgi:NADH dehydrogenase